MFTTPTGEPITTKLLVAAAPQPTSAPMVMIDFGTGQRFPPTNLTSATYAPGAQALYGIWDWILSSWNTASATQYASLPGPHGLTAANLTAQTLIQQVAYALSDKIFSYSPESFDLDIAAKEQCDEFGIGYDRIELPNTDPLFINALANITRNDPTSINS